ncbi:unnamed protein product [Lota lota]
MTLGQAPETLGFPRGTRQLRLRERHLACIQLFGSQRGVSRLLERGLAFLMAPSPAKAWRIRNGGKNGLDAMDPSRNGSRLLAVGGLNM